MCVGVFVFYALSSRHGSLVPFALRDGLVPFAFERLVGLLLVCLTCCVLLVVMYYAVCLVLSCLVLSCFALPSPYRVSYSFEWC